MICGGILTGLGIVSAPSRAGTAGGLGFQFKFHFSSIAAPHYFGLTLIVICTTFFVEPLPRSARKTGPVSGIVLICIRGNNNQVVHGQPGASRLCRGFAPGRGFPNPCWRRFPYLFSVAQTSKSAVPQVSKPADGSAAGRLGSRRYSRFGNLRHATMPALR
jgi:hypothetical protein